MYYPKNTDKHIIKLTKLNMIQINKVLSFFFRFYNPLFYNKLLRDLLRENRHCVI